MMITIPVTAFDQSKLEQLLRKAPDAFVREESMPNFVRKHYLLPKDPSLFQIQCHADYYVDAPEPSDEKCTLTSSAAVSGDEISFKMKNPGFTVPKFISTERVYGQAFDGRYRQLFRYMFDCTKGQECLITFAVKKAIE